MYIARKFPSQREWLVKAGNPKIASLLEAKSASPAPMLLTIPAAEPDNPFPSRRVEGSLWLTIPCIFMQQHLIVQVAVPARLGTVLCIKCDRLISEE